MIKKLAIAIEESENAIEKVAEHFGHCSKFDIYDIEDGKVTKKESIFNPLNGHEGGGCQLPAYIKQFDIDTVIAGGMGAKAANNFIANNIEVITAPGLDKNTALNMFLENKLKGFTECTNHSHNCSHV